MNNGEITRPGISPSFLARHNIRHVDGSQAEALTGYKVSGIAIAYHGLNSTELIVKDRPFCRIRLDKPINGTKYLQARDTGSQLFIPQGVPFGKELVITEGEFKAMSLCDAGISAVGIGGITSAMKDGELIPGLASIFRKYNPSIVYLLGDSDTVFLFEFSREAVKLARKLPEGCTLRLPRIPLSAPGKGIDDAREALRDGFLAFWRGIIEKAVKVSSKADASGLCLALLLPELPTIRDSPECRDYVAQIKTLSTWLDESELAKLARAAKEYFDIPVSAFKRDATKRSYDDANERPSPNFYFDGGSYFRPYQDGFERLSREDTALALRSMGFRHRTAANCELSPCEVRLHRLQQENRVDYAGPLCGRPPGFWQEGSTRVLCTRGPKVIPAQQGDASALEAFFFSLLGDGRDQFFREQFLTFCGWIVRARYALRNPDQHLPGQALALVGPVDCGKSLLQSINTLMIGGREADPSLWLVKGNDFNGSIWRAEHLRLGDEELIEDSRDRHGLRDRVKKMVTAELFPLHRKHQEAIDFRPIWRVSISCNDDGGSLAVLPPLSEDFSDKIIYLKCYPPLKPYHDGTNERSREFWERLTGAIPAFLHKIETHPLPEEFRASRFYVKEFHHPDVVELMSEASPVAPLGELLMKWLDHVGGSEEGSAVELFEKLKQWYKKEYDEKNLSGYSSGSSHFGHQLRKLSELPGWKNRITKGEPRRVGPNRQKQTIWKIVSG